MPGTEVRLGKSGVDMGRVNVFIIKYAESYIIPGEVHHQQDLLAQSALANSSLNNERHSSSKQDDGTHQAQVV